jgi:Asp-tRNA(Asn)/Glu-tRNA(Gln) amidotransferase A subunit family amidase
MIFAPLRPWPTSLKREMGLSLLCGRFFFFRAERRQTTTGFNPLMNDLVRHANRRAFIAACAGIGVTSNFFAGALYALASQNPTLQIDDTMIDEAAFLAGVSITPGQKKDMVVKLYQQLRGIKAVRKLNLTDDVPPAYRFDPLLVSRFPSEAEPVRTAKVISQAPNIADSEVPKDLEQLAYSPVWELGELLRRQKIKAVDLTQMYLARLKRLDSRLHFLITLTDERAIAQAKEVDREIAAGRYRGPLHGIPWGAKDLLAVKDYPTTWGAGGFQQQTFDADATVVQRLDEAGAILVAKLTLGALASGDKWFGGRTRNPWNPDQGSSGSSAGSAAATASGCVGFAIGSETLGSISSPSTRCGTSGYRPTFGFVPRTGAMALAWTMDKLGPICRSVEDCALVMQAIYGPDGSDLTVHAAPFSWDAQFDWRSLKIGYAKSTFEPPKQEDTPPDDASPEELKEWEDQKSDRAAARVRADYDRQYDVAALERLKKMGVDLQAIELPDFPVDAISQLLGAEAAAAFDDLTLSGRDTLLTEQSSEDWPNLFRVARFFPAVDYIQANRARTELMHAMAEIFSKVDVIVVPSSSSTQLTITNLTGHPAVIVPNGIRGQDAPKPPAIDTGDDDSIGGPGTPLSITFLGNLYQDAKLLAFARAYQNTSGFVNLRPPGFA